MNTALEYSTRVVQEGGRRCKKSTLNDLVHLTPLRKPLMNPPYDVFNSGMNLCTFYKDAAGIVYNLHFLPLLSHPLYYLAVYCFIFDLKKLLLFFFSNGNSDSSCISTSVKCCLSDSE
jgi:hypothetical protein